MDMKYNDRLRRVIAIIRSHPEWKPEHSIIKFPKGEIGYYDTSRKSDYFDIKYNRITINHSDSAQIKLEEASIDAAEGFSLDKWLTEVEQVVEPNFIVINGKKYILTEVTDVKANILS